jgi:uncharacterized surface protein with fasciclin (FAS1) repeats
MNSEKCCKTHRAADKMTGITNKTVFSSILICAVLLTACEKKFDEYYKVPEDLIGTILEVLEEDGNYTQFIKAVELVEYDDVLGKTGNFTVFAPDDNAFAEFFTESGYTSLEDIPEKELDGIVYYHIVFWAYSKFMLLYGLGIQDVDIDYSPLNFKQITKFIPPMTVEFDTLGQDYTVYHESKFIPVYSSELFAEMDLNASENYSFLYPGTSFSGFNVDRAEVVEADVPAQNGWIHKINKVLIPPDNHDDILEKKPEFSVFRELLERNTFYQYNQTYTTQQDNEGDVNEDGILDSLFLKMNIIFPSGSSPDGENVGYNGHQNVLTLFAPTNDALQNFMNNYTTGYSSIYQIGAYWINWYLSHYMGANYWPSRFSTLTEDWEMDLVASLIDCNISEEDIYYSQMASNGPFCGINKFFLPKIYESVAQPIFGNADYEWFSDMLVFYMADQLLNEENLEFTLFAPTNSAIDESGYMFRTGLGGWGIYSKSNPLAPIPRQFGSDIVKTHIVFGELSESDFEEGSFIETSQHTYIGITQDGIYSGGDITPAKLSAPEIVSGKGVLYKIDRMLVSPRFSIFDIISNPNIYPQYQKFYQLCYESGLMLLDENQSPISLNNISVGTYYSCFIPTNEALIQAISDGIVPADPEELQQFLRYHFVEGVIFSDGETSGEFNTTRIDEVSGYLFNTIEIINQKYDLKVKDNLGNIRNVLPVFPNLMAEDGVVHQIDSVLLFK